MDGRCTSRDALVEPLLQYRIALENYTTHTKYKHTVSISLRRSVIQREGSRLSDLSGGEKKEIVVAYSATPCFILVLTLRRGQSDSSEIVTLCSRCTGGEASTQCSMA